ncbi:FecR domain-containing protein [Brucella sp. 21LCYQ03]|nr:FecR domain-containing protein [Brucella sp. 21LCYQ03]
MDEPEQRSENDHHISMDARDWIVRLTSGDVSEADLKRFKVWRDASSTNRQAFERERVFWQELQALDAKPAASVLTSDQIVLSQPRLGRRAFLAGGGIALAASVTAFGLPVLRTWWEADFATGVGQQAEVPLPDGSFAFLNTDSAISVDFRPDFRLIHLLKGEVDFRVAQQNTLFRVTSQEGNSDALGTIFTVQATDETTTVTVSQGQVHVSAGAATSDGGNVLLSASEQTSYKRGGAPTLAHHVDLDTELAWKTGRLIFEGRSFGNVVADIGRYLPERIVLGPGVNSSVPVSGVFATSELLSAIRALSQTQGLSVRRVPGVVILIA